MRVFKYCASGNDFVVFDADARADRSALARKICDRYEGVGADGMIVVLPCEGYDFEWEFYNCDGSRPKMCGNGARAAAHFAHFVLQKDAKMCFLSEAGAIEAKVLEDGVVIALGGARDLRAPFEEEGKIWQGCDTGVPHLVHFCEDLEEFDLKLCKKMREKYDANVNFAKIIDENCIRVRTFERGVEGETLACGTGMGACFYLALMQGRVVREAKLIPKSGEELFFKFFEEKIYFKGKVKCCFEAHYYFA